MDDTWLCIPCRVECLEYPDDEYHIFFVDVSGGIKEHELVGFHPQLRVGRRFDFMTFWVKQSKLYMISHNSKLVASVKLSVELLRTPDPVELVDSMIKYVAPMNYPKQWPMIVPTLDGKILAMSTTIQSHLAPSEIESDAYLAYGTMVDFEIYDSSNDSWEPLPEIQLFWPDQTLQICSVESAAFINQDTLFVKTSCKGVFLFMLNISKKIWGVSDKLVESCEFPRMGITAVVNGELGFNPYNVIDINHLSRTASVCGCVPSFFGDLDDYNHEHNSCLVSGEGSGCNFYTVDVARQKKTKHIKFIVRGYWLDIGKYNEDKRKLESGWRKEIEDAENEHNMKVLMLRQKYDKMVGGKSLDKHLQDLEFELSGSLARLRQKWKGQPDINMNLTTSSQLKMNSLKFSDFEPEELSFVSISALASGSTSSPPSSPGDGKRPRLH